MAEGVGARTALFGVTLSILCACSGSSVPVRTSSAKEEATRSQGNEVAQMDNETRGTEADPASSESVPGAAPGPRSFGYLELPGFLPAPFFAPERLGHSELAPLRVFVIAHGAGGRGEHHCAFWEPVFPSDVVLICPQGSLLDRSAPEGGAYFPDHLALRRELVALVDSVTDKWGTKVRDVGWRYIGYSQGATMGALAIVGELAIFEELVLIEGGGESWTTQRALDFKAGGGERVLFACGTPGCKKRGDHSESVLLQAGIEARHVHAPGGGHTYGGEVGRLAYEGMSAWDSL